MKSLKNLKNIVLVVMIFIALTGCAANNDGTNSSIYSSSSSGDGRLTTTKAETALKRWTGSRGEVTVGGVQEISGQNAAKVDISLASYTFTSKDSIIGDQRKVYTGPGTAIFVRYNDGRWMLSKVAFTMRGGMIFTFDNINIEAQ